MKKTLDLGTEKIGKLLLSFSIPCIISMLINSVYNIVDQIFIGQGVGYVGNAATNVIFPLVILCNAIAGLLGNGCSANLSLRLGEGKGKEASRAVGSTITFTILFSIVFSFICFLILPTLVTCFGCTPNVYPYAIAYGRIILIGAPFMIVYSALASIIRADGSPKYSMILLVTGAIVNIILDAIFILKFHMGVEGGALATIIGQIISCVMALCYLKKFKSIQLTKEDYRIDRSILKVAGYGLSSCITQATVLALFVFMNNIMTRYGASSEFGSDIPLSVYGVVSKLNSLFISSVLGIAIGAQPIIGFNYGAGKYKRVRETLKKVITVNFIIGVVFNLIFLLFPKQLVGLFGSSDNSLYVKFAVDFCRTFLLISCLNAFEISSSVVIQSFGNVKKATLISFIRQILLFIPIALVLTHFMGLYGALYAGPIADGICFICVLFIFGSEYKKIGKVENAKEIEELNVSSKKVGTLSKNIVVTISREYGSGGRYVGKMLADSLGIPFYDKELISLAAKESGFTEDYIQENEQKKNKGGVSEYNGEDAIFIAESKVIQSLAEKGSCVIVGRCADYVLKDKENVFRIFLYSSMEDKVRRAVQYYHLEEKNAVKQIQKVDKERAKHYKYYTNQEWKDFSHYDFALNVGSLGVDAASDMIRDILMKKVRD